MKYMKQIAVHMLPNAASFLGLNHSFADIQFNDTRSSDIA